MFSYPCVARTHRRPQPRFRKTEFSKSIQRRSGNPILMRKFCFRFSEKCASLSSSRLDERGVRVVTDVEAGCDGRGGGARRASPARTVKVCGPGLPTLRPSFADTKTRGDGSKKARFPGRARYKP